MSNEYKDWLRDEEQEKRLWVIMVDETPEPWEDYSYQSEVVYGTEEQAERYANDKYADHPDWSVYARRVYDSDKVTYLEDE